MALFIFVTISRGVLAGAGDAEPGDLDEIGIAEFLERRDISESLGIRFSDVTASGMRVPARICPSAEVQVIEPELDGAGDQIGDRGRACRASGCAGP